MKCNYFRALWLSAIALALPAGATLTTVTVPSTQAEFEEQWFQIHSESAPAWELVGDFTPSYARVHPEYGYNSYPNERGDGQGLFIADGITMKAGDSYNLQVSVTTSHFNDDHAFRFAYTTDKTAYTVVGPEVTIYNKSGGDIAFQTKPSATTFTTFTAPEDGTYYFGVISRGGKNKDTSYLCVSSLSYELKVDYPQQVTGISVTSPKSAALEATVSWTWPKKSDAGADLTGVNARVYRSQSASFDLAAVDFVADVQNGTPGEAGSFTDTTVPAPGRYYYFVQTYYGDGVNPNPKYDYVKWVGEDVKCLNIVANTASLTPEGNGFRIEFVKRVEGYNGGWGGPRQAFIKITRQKNNEEAVTVVSDYQGDSPYVDAEVDGPGSYTYRLYVVYKEEESAECKLGPVFGGGAETVPYSENFTEAASMNNFTVISDNTSYKWNRSYSGYLQFNGGYSSYSSAKSNVMTPPLALEAGNTYKVTCTSWVDESEYDDDYGYGYTYTEPVPRDLTLTAGKLATFDGQAQIAKVNVNVAEADKKTFEAFFSPSESGNYYFGFQAEFGGTDKIYIDDINIVASELLPADVADFKAVADPAGAKSAAVTFTVPSLSNGGQPLADMTSVTVSRLADGEETPVVVKTIEGDECTPGAAVSFVDEVPVENNYVYTVVARLGEKESNPVSAPKMWVGYDYPKNISSFTVSLNRNDNGEGVLSWTPLSGPSFARNGGYVDADNLKYRVYRIAGRDADGERMLVGETATSPFVDAEAPSLPWDSYRYAVSPVNGHMEGEVAVCNNTKVLGDAISLPYEPDFTDDESTYTWDGRGFIVRNGALSCYNKGELEEGSDYSAIIPPFYSIDSDKAAVDITLSLSRDSEEYEEVLEVYAVRLGDLRQDNPQQGETPAQKPSRVAENDNLLTSMVVTALPEEPQTAALNLKLPSTGKYRIKFRTASLYNAGLNIHAMKIANSTYTGVAAVTADGSLRYDAATGCVILGTDVASATAWSANGMTVARTDDGGVLDLSALPAGVYVVRAVKTDGTPVTLKLNR